MKNGRNWKHFTLTTMICLVLIMCISIQTTAFAAGMEPGTIAYVCADTKLNLRDKPQGNIIGKLPKGETVTILSEIDRNGYYFIEVHKTGQKCYAYGEYLAFLYFDSYEEPVVTPIQPETFEDIKFVEEPEDTFPEGAILVVISDKQLNMRKKANRQADRIQYLEYGEKLMVVSSKVRNNYILVRDLNDGKLGYVDISFVALDGERCCDACYCLACKMAN